MIVGLLKGSKLELQCKVLFLDKNNGTFKATVKAFLSETSIMCF